jgi:hypothetical protein
MHLRRAPTRTSDPAMPTEPRLLAVVVLARAAAKRFDGAAL